MVRILITLAASLLLGWLIGKVLLPVLRALKAGQSIREVGPKWHASKAGTPTMGGLLFIGAALVCIVTAWPAMRRGDFGHLYVFGFALVFGVIGFLDDFMKVKYHRNLGLTALQKLVLQLGASACYLMLLRWSGHLSAELYIPFADISVPIPWPVYVIFAMLVMVGCVNAVNLTDGIDGLAASVTVPVTAFFLICAVKAQQMGLSLFCAALIGGLLAFLVYNFHPAKMFMGDTGSLFLGGVVCGLAFALDMPLVLVLVGLIYLIETLSVILQVGYFKLTHGKRIFRMTPIHHHFEMGGWSEVKIVVVFTTVTVLMCALAWLGVMNRY